MKKKIVISVFAQDRPGIIAEISNIIFELKGDLADISQSVLSGFFSMLIIANFNDDITENIIKSKINEIQSDKELYCIVREMIEDSESLLDNDPADIYVITGQGQNRTGLVAAMSSFCRDYNINIIGYDTKLSGDTYAMMLHIAVPPALSVNLIHDNLDLMAEKLGLKLVMQHMDLFKTVNEISY